MSLSNRYKTKTEYKPQAKFGKRILVTGANGFVGEAVCEELLREGFKVRGVVRQILPSTVKSEVEYLTVGDINEITDWSTALIDVEVIIHLAGRVHVMHDTADDPLAEFLRVNAAGTEHLVKCAVASGVKRIVYVSSIKVNGELTQDGHEFSEADPPLPRDDYGVSKWTAERMLQSLARDTSLEVVVIRPPLVYGPGVKANFLLLMRWIDYGIPLPFGSIKNERNLLFLGNLVNALITCTTHPAAVGETYLVSDAERVSTPQLFASMANALNRPLRVFPFPVSIMRFFANFIGKSAEIDRLTQSLAIDCAKIRNELGWYPIYTMAQGLAITAAWYQTSSKSLSD